MKKHLIILAVIITLGGCATIQKYAKQGLDAADKAAGKYVDGKAGSGSYEDSKAMSGDNDKTQNLLPYYIAVNKLCDEKKVDTNKRDDLKKQFSQLYDQWKSGKIQKDEYDKKCTELVEKSKG